MRSRAGRWARYLSIDIPEGYLPVAAGLLMAWQAGGGPNFALRASLLIVGAMAILFFIHGSDNIVGFRRGVDRIVYRRGAVIKEPKLLVTGEIAPREALWLTGSLVVPILGISGYLAWTSHWLAALLGIAVMVVTSQYSVGLRLSYRGLGELVVFLTGLGTPIAFIATTGRVAWEPFLVGAMLGLFSAAVNINSNHADRPYDLEAGRRTLAVRIGPEWNRRAAAAMLVVAWALMGVSLVMGALPRAAALSLLLLPRSFKQLRCLYADDPIEARRIGFATFRLLFVVLCAVWIAQGGSDVSPELSSR